ncbi:MAG: hypothetical protein US15_C0057G0003 [Candidatus Moranbacteria bacterium GW2011_GWF1_36_4]|nr:MAG: hypothetical protein US15_C0057G0003 [Candidatus Moranbacteria bacterium GW2011_GWF1_36_4]HBD93523.1 hypothetical protein [Spirochaetia bacterium]
MRTLIKNKILELFGKQSEFCEKHKIRKATLYDFLNKKIDIRLSTLEDIIKPLKLKLCEKLSGELIEVEVVYDGDTKYIKGENAALCFGSTATTYQYVIIKKGEDYILKII